MNIADLTTDDIMSVYSGKAGRCCCGCSGNHRVNSKRVIESAKDSGYGVSPKDINDRQVKKVLNLIKANAANAVIDEPSNISVEIGERLYIAYLVPAIVADKIVMVG